MLLVALAVGRQSTSPAMADGGDCMDGYAVGAFARVIRALPANPAKPQPKSSNVAGSGTVGGPPGPGGGVPVPPVTVPPEVIKGKPLQPVLMVSLIIVTVPVLAKALPQFMVTP